MSGRKDSERAESGLIFRDGHLVSKEDWYKAHPTPQMLIEQRAQVKDAVTAEMASKFRSEDELRAEGLVNDLTLPRDITYYTCNKCQRKHKVGTKIFTAHRKHAKTPLGLA